MGGYGAMNIALSNPYRYSVAESWLGFFNGLQGELRGDRAIFSRLGLSALVYGAESDHIANPAEDLPFAAALRASGARARGRDLSRRTQPGNDRSPPRKRARVRRARARQAVRACGVRCSRSPRVAGIGRAPGKRPARVARRLTQAVSQRLGFSTNTV